MNDIGTHNKLRLAGALSGAAFAVLTLIAYVLNPGPKSGYGVYVVEYYTAHGDKTLWSAALVGVAVVLFIWFAEAFAAAMSSPAGLVGAAITAALYFVAVGCWGILGELFGDLSIVDVPSDAYSDGHVIFDVGVGAAHMGHFAAAAFVGACAVALLSSGQRTLGWVGVTIAAFRLVSAAIDLVADSTWSDVVGTAGFLAFLAWVFASSLALARVRQRGARLVPQTA